jgi:hypothetical protein
MMPPLKNHLNIFSWQMGWLWHCFHDYNDYKTKKTKMHIMHKQKGWVVWFKAKSIDKNSIATISR